MKRVSTLPALQSPKSLLIACALGGLAATLLVAPRARVAPRVRVTARQNRVATPGEPAVPAGTPSGVGRRLTGTDYAFWFSGLPVQPLNVMSLILLAPGAAPDGSSAPLDLDRLRRHVADRLGALPLFRWRVVPVPFGLSQPVWVEDPEFDITLHIEEHVLAAPGTAEQLDAFYAEQAGRPLDRGRPMWRLTLLHGLADGRQAAVLTTHHGVCDGFAFLNTLGILLGELGSDAPSVPTSAVSVSSVSPVALPTPSRVPGAGRLLADALAHQARTARRLPALLRTSKAAGDAVKTAKAAYPIVPPAEKDSPLCPLDRGPLDRGPLDRVDPGRRAFARTSLAPEDLQQVQDAAGVTVNEVTLALVSGALRDYLYACNSLPSSPLVATVAVGLDRPSAPPRTFGNRVSDLHTTLATDVADPWERLLTIGEVTARAKRLLVIGKPKLAGEWMDQIPPVVLNPILGHHRRRFHREVRTGEDRLNIVISQVRGELRGGSLDGVPLEAYYNTAAVSGARGVYVVLTGCPDRIFVSILCVDPAPPPGELVDGMHRSLQELLALAAGRRAAVPVRPEKIMAMEQM